MSPKEKAIVLLSGGLDSTVSLALALETYDVILSLTVNYGQRAYAKELKASKLISESFGVSHDVVVLPWLAALLPKALQVRNSGSDDKEWLAGDQQTAEFFEAAPVWVPNRNGLFINIAATYAEALGAQVIIFGANAEEGERFPDNTPAFRERANALFDYSTLHHPRLEAPVETWDKPQMVRWAADHQVPLHFVWSCYDDGPTQCGQCPSCYRFKKALAEAAVESTLKRPVVFSLGGGHM